MNYVSSKEARKYYKVSEETLRRWANKGKIKYELTEGGHRRYQIFPKKKVGLKIIYARVSSRKQKEDLERQIKHLQEKFPGYKVIKDVASGLNFERKGIQRILDELFESNIQELVVFSKDRLCRFGFPLFEYMFGYFGAKLTVVENEKNKTEHEELVEDMLAITTVFAAKIHSRRKYKIQ